MTTRLAIRPMTSRQPAEPHRVATPLELLFDLVFVVAVAQAAAGLHHAVAENHAATGVTGFVMVFFAIWWAWMNFTWFASAYDTDDVPYRIAVFVQMTGALVVAAGVSRAMDDKDFTVITFGYVLMRLAAVSQWLRAAVSDPERRRTCLRYAIGITIVQIGWVLRLLLPDGAPGMTGFVVLVIADLAVPVFAERGVSTAWHPHHIAERYSLFTIIVLGESILSATVAVKSAMDAEDEIGYAHLGLTAIGGLLIVFSMWWLYFSKPAHDLLTSIRKSMLWGYGHYLIFGSAAAVGAGLAVSVDHAAHKAHIGSLGAGLAVTVPVAVFLVTLWLLHLRPHHAGRAHGWVGPVAAVLVLAASFTGEPVLVTGLVLVAAIVVGEYTRDRTEGAGQD
ncbi:low temperature requirement protein A [Streptomyces boninensis]|uniref:low temperature requirement protein A n=1 Tax=Streptomyces boninensis TaxID=2039455 RepID=UPI003B2166CD